MISRGLHISFLQYLLTWLPANLFDKYLPNPANIECCSYSSFITVSNILIYIPPVAFGRILNYILWSLTEENYFLKDTYQPPYFHYVHYNSGHLMGIQDKSNN